MVAEPPDLDDDMGVGATDELASRRTVRPYAIAVVVVSLWAGYSVAYIGQEDGSSGLSLLGYVHAVFLLPGVWILQAFTGRSVTATWRSAPRSAG